MSNAEQKYFQSQVENTSPLGLVVLLYDGCIRFLRNAKTAIDQKDIETSDILISKARNIISELMVSLNFEEGGEISEKLMSLYLFMYEQLVKANLHKDNECIDSCLDLLEGLHESWTKIANKQEFIGASEETSQSASSPGVNFQG